jgi:hypothetical protein
MKEIEYSAFDWFNVDTNLSVVISIFKECHRQYCACDDSHTFSLEVIEPWNDVRVSILFITAKVKELIFKKICC